LEYIRQQGPDTKWVVHLLTNVTFYVNKLFDHPIGARPYFEEQSCRCFSLNVYVYDLQETEAGDIAARLVRRSPYSYQETMTLNLYEQRFSYVSDMEKYSHSFLCSKCDRL
jgi:hypothetical protein